MDRDYNKEIEDLEIKEVGFILDEGCGLMDGEIIIDIPADLFNVIFLSENLRNILSDKITEHEPYLDTTAELGHEKIMKISAVIIDGEGIFRVSQKRQYFDISEGEDAGDYADRDTIDIHGSSRYL